MRRSLPLLVLAVAAPLLLLAMGPSAGNSAGVDGVGKGGCVCHGAMSAQASVNVTGFPAAYVPGSNYTLTVTVTGPAALPVGLNQGGFSLDLEAENGSAGLLDPIGGTTVQIVDGVRATHTGDGNGQREWTLGWTAPAAGAGTVTAYLSANAVNGDGLNGPGDHWASAVVLVPELVPPAPEPVVEQPPEEPKETPGPGLWGLLAGVAAVAAAFRGTPRHL
ncbi:MAG TPA: choice-of-anchor V domain-containing protein [Candidatus Thermoplasmatota archaeon]|nr:choice-of-anchor V domain-containing protein [Candidatus Thermoplasmatota archaeon]